MTTVGVVTGAASGMGRACVDRVRGAVEHLVAVDLREPEIDGVDGVACDVTDAVALAALADRVRALGSFRRPRRQHVTATGARRRSGPAPRA